MAVSLKSALVCHYAVLVATVYIILALWHDSVLFLSYSCEGQQICHITVYHQKGRRYGLSVSLSIPFRSILTDDATLDVLWESIKTAESFKGDQINFYSICH